MKSHIIIIVLGSLLSISFNQKSKLNIPQQKVGPDIIQVVNLSEKFSIEAEINPDIYILGPGDKLGLNIVTSENTTFILTVTPTGDLWIPQVGSIHISGKSINDAKSEVSDFVRKNAFTNADIELVILNVRTFIIQVLGAVNNPGFVAVNSIDRVSNVVSKTGGLHKLADEDLITVTGLESTKTFSLGIFSKSGDLEHNPIIREGDVVKIPYKEEFKYLIEETITANKTAVVVTGFVAKPSGHNYYPGYTVMDYIGFSGGVLDMGSLKNIEIYRNGEMFAPNITDTVRPGDQIYVPANTKYRFLGNVSILQTVTAIMSLYLTFQAATAN